MTRYLNETNAIGSNDANNSFDSSNVVGNKDGSVLERLEALNSDLVLVHDAASDIISAASMIKDIQSDLVLIHDAASDLVSAASFMKDVRSDLIGMDVDVDEILSHVIDVSSDVVVHGVIIKNIESVLLDVQSDLVLIHNSASDIVSISSNLKTVMLDLDLDRSGDSGTKTLTGGEDTLYEYTVNTVPYQFLGGYIDLTNQAAGDTVVLRVYAKVKSGGNYIKLRNTTYAGVQSPLLRAIGSLYNQYSTKVTIEHTVVAAAFDVDHEWFEKLGG